MSRVAVIINGVPGAGKTTLAGPLGRELGIPVIRKDAIKEGLADLVAAVRFPTRPLGALAIEVMWQMVGMIDEPVILESFWSTGRDEVFFERGLVTGGVEVGVEIWCTVPNELARARFVERPRHPVHQDRDQPFEWDHLATAARPISRFPVVELSTVGVVDVAALATDVRRLLPELART